MDGYYTWQALGTFAGAAGATALMTQLIKNIFTKVPTQLVSFLVALVILLLATASSSPASWSAWAIVPFNAALVSLSANGGYAAVKRITDAQTIEKN